MTTSTVQLLTALLTIVTLLAVVIAVVAFLLGRRSAVAADVTAAIAEHRSLLVGVITGAAMAGSLYYSEVAHYVPCTLCWYQRIAMYSLAVLAITAAIRGETPTAYFVVLAAIGAPISAYHWLLERIPELDTGACSVTAPCSFVWFERFGFVTLPFMALVAFSAVLAFSLPPRKELT